MALGTKQKQFLSDYSHQHTLPDAYQAFLDGNFKVGDFIGEFTRDGDSLMSLALHTKNIEFVKHLNSKGYAFLYHKGNKHAPNDIMYEFLQHIEEKAYIPEDLVKFTIQLFETGHTDVAQHISKIACILNRTNDPYFLDPKFQSALSASLIKTEGNSNGYRYFVQSPETILDRLFSSAIKNDNLDFLKTNITLLEKFIKSKYPEYKFKLEEVPVSEDDKIIRGQASTRDTGIASLPTIAAAYKSPKVLSYLLDNYNFSLDGKITNYNYYSRHAVYAKGHYSNMSTLSHVPLLKVITESFTPEIAKIVLSKDSMEVLNEKSLPYLNSMFKKIDYFSKDKQHIEMVEFFKQHDMFNNGITATTKTPTNSYYSSGYRDNDSTHFAILQPILERYTLSAMLQKRGSRYSDFSEAEVENINNLEQFDKAELKTVLDNLFSKDFDLSNTDDGKFVGRIFNFALGNIHTLQVDIPEVANRVLNFKEYEPSQEFVDYWNSENCQHRMAYENQTKLIGNTLDMATFLYDYFTEKLNLKKYNNSDTVRRYQSNNFSVLRHLNLHSKHFSPDYRTAESSTTLIEFIVNQHRSSRENNPENSSLVEQLLSELIANSSITNGGYNLDDYFHKESGKNKYRADIIGELVGSEETPQSATHNLSLLPKDFTTKLFSYMQKTDPTSVFQLSSNSPITDDIINIFMDYGITINHKDKSQQSGIIHLLQNLRTRQVETIDRIEKDFRFSFKEFFDSANVENEYHVTFLRAFTDHTTAEHLTSKGVIFDQNTIDKFIKHNLLNSLSVVHTVDSCTFENLFKLGYNFNDYSKNNNNQTFLIDLIKNKQIELAIKLIELNPNLAREVNKQKKNAIHYLTPLLAKQTTLEPITKGEYDHSNDHNIRNHGIELLLLLIKNGCSLTQKAANKDTPQSLIDSYRISLKSKDLDERISKAAVDFALSKQTIQPVKKAKKI